MKSNKDVTYQKYQPPKLERSSCTMFKVFLFNFSDKVRINGARIGMLYTEVIGADATLIVIDGIHVRVEQYEFLASIPQSEVKSFEIIECAKSFHTHY